MIKNIEELKQELQNKRQERKELSKIILKLSKKIKDYYYYRSKKWK